MPHNLIFVCTLMSKSRASNVNNTQNPTLLFSSEVQSEGEHFLDIATDQWQSGVHVVQLTTNQGVFFTYFVKQ
jgi:hypothetical protein